MRALWLGCWKFWSADDPHSIGREVWIATGITDMRRGMNGLSLQVQEAFGRDPHAGDLYVFRGRRGDLIKVLWHDGLGLSLYAKRLERGRFILAVGGCRCGCDRIGANSATCWRRSTGETHNIHGGRGAPDRHSKKLAWCAETGASNRPFYDSISVMSAGAEALPDDIETLKAALVVARAEVAIARARQSDDQALIAHLKLQIEKLNRDRYGPRSERTARLLNRAGAASSDQLKPKQQAA